mmetsp:Transcript_32103/g.70171  ORF Transcript_32103/g.70171 Transcript_32103/m.70171 type:complete len:260 (-) Transcript_32103:116-895(-)
MRDIHTRKFFSITWSTSPPLDVSVDMVAAEIDWVTSSGLMPCLPSGVPKGSTLRTLWISSKVSLPNSFRRCILPWCSSVNSEVSLHVGGDALWLLSATPGTPGRAWRWEALPSACLHPSLAPVEGVEGGNPPIDSLTVLTTVVTQASSLDIADFRSFMLKPCKSEAPDGSCKDVLWLQGSEGGKEQGAREMRLTLFLELDLRGRPWPVSLSSNALNLLVMNFRISTMSFTVAALPPRNCKITSMNSSKDNAISLPSGLS